MIFAGCISPRRKPCASIVPVNIRSLSTLTRRKKHSISHMSTVSTGPHSASIVTSSSTPLVHSSNTSLRMPADRGKRLLRQIVAVQSPLHVMRKCACRLRGQCPRRSHLGVRPIGPNEKHVARRRRQARISRSLEVVRLRPICVESRCHCRFSRTGARSFFNVADSAITGSRRAAQSKNASNVCINACGMAL